MGAWPQNEFSTGPRFRARGNDALLGWVLSRSVCDSVRPVSDAVRGSAVGSQLAVPVCPNSMLSLNHGNTKSGYVYNTVI